MGTENLDRSAVGAIELDAGSGWRALGIITEETVRVNGKEVTHMDVSGYPFGADKTIFGSVNIEIEFVWEEIADIDLWNLALHGGNMTTSVAGIQAVTSESIVLTGTNLMALSHAADFTFDCSVAIDNEAGTITYTEGVDYYLDRKGGHVKRIAGGSITDGQTIHIDYTYNTHVGNYFTIFADSSPVDYAMRLTKPLLNGNNMRITHSKANFSSTAELPLKPGEEGVWAGVTSKIKLMKDSGGVYGAYGRWEIYTP
jgi:hypothetical protein